MGIIQKIRDYFQKRDERHLARNAKILLNPKAIREERQAALEFFCDHTDAAAVIPTLLKRFDFSLDHGINDTREKERAMQGILSHKDHVLPYLKEHLKNSDRIAWPIKVLIQIASAEEVTKTLEDCLDFSDNDFDQRLVDKNYDVLCYLRDFKLTHESTLRLLHFLKAHDERVRFAAVEAMLEQDYKDVVEQLEGLLLDTSAENIRLRQAVIDAFVVKQWPLSQKQLFQPGPISEGKTITKQFTIEAIHA